MSQTHPSSIGDYYDLGSYHRVVTTNNKQAQTWFDRGLIWTYAFNHGEAAKCFQKASECDHGCAMAYWGLAYCVGPNYNKPWEAFDEGEMETSIKLTHIALTNAEACAATASPVERALIYALRFRYPKDWSSKEFSVWNQKYSQAMQNVSIRFPGDLDVAALYTDSLMNLTPWKLWDIRTGEPAEGSRVLEAKAVLDQALTTEAGLKHPGLLHLYIHLMEMSSTPESALTTADRLRGLVPDSGHLNHMPTHLDILCGDYRRAVASNSDAILADERFFFFESPVNFYALYRCHNYHFRIYAAMFSGQSNIAFQTVEKLEKCVPEGLLRIESPPMADWLEGFLSTKIHVLIRFGRWKDIIALELPQDQELHCVTTAMIHYGKAIALAATIKATSKGHIPAAEAQRVLFQKAVKRVPESRTLFNNKCIDILAVASAMLDGELEYRKGKFQLAFFHLEQSIHLDDRLPYDEPWGWMQPTRHAYGALLLEQGRVEEAAKVYAADLGFDDTLPRALRHPNNVWALHGYHECLVKLGRSAEAAVLEPQLKLALAVADVKIKASCFCRLETGG